MVRSFGALAVVGAGVSADHYPMTAQLPPLLWHAITDDPEALAELRVRTRATGSAKEILSSSPDRLGVGWQIVREYTLARMAFQSAFAVLDADREPSSAHVDLARLVNSGHVEMVVSYNWDTCLERAYERMYGVELPTGLLHKPHGDAARPHDDWVLPDEDGRVPSGVLDRVARLSDRPRTLVVLGYSGSDATVVETLLAPLQERWPVVRVGPSASGEGAIASTADTALAAFASQVASAEPLSGWRYVTFLRSRSLLAALRGERLRPTDVDACPELPAAPRLADRLLASRFATLSGSSGTGKSVTAFHAARRLNRAGWRVVELKQPGVATAGDVEEFRRLQGPVLAVVDDTQAIHQDVAADFESSADDSHAVLLVSTERLEAREGETLLAAQSMQVLHEYCQANIDAVAPLLTQLDDRVRWSALNDDSPAQRLDLALRTAAEPWLYMFVASGGERRITGALDRAADDVDAALVLAFICVAQLTSRDAGVTRDELATVTARHASTRFCAAGVLQSDRMDRALLFLANERLVREHDGRIRAAHMRIAERALQDLGRREAHEIASAVRASVRAALLDDAINLVGKRWLLNVFEQLDAYVHRWANTIVDEDVSSSLLRQCLAAAPGRDRGVALSLLWASEWLSRLPDDAAEELANSMISWFPTLTPEECYGYRWALSGLRSRHEPAYERIRNQIPARAIAEQLSVTGSRPTAMSWAQIIEQLCPDFQKGGLLDWSQEFEQALDPDLLAGWLSDRDSYSHPFEIYDLIDTLASLAPRAAKVAFEACAVEISDAMERDLADAASNFGDWAFGTMLVVANLADAPSAIPDDEYVIDHSNDDLVAARFAFLETKEPELRDLAVAVLAVMESINWTAATQSLERKKHYEIHSLDLLLTWLTALSTGITDTIAAALSPEWILRIADESSREHPDVPEFSAVDNILSMLCAGEKGEAAVRRLLEKHDHDFDPFPSILIRRFPNLAARSIRRGMRVEVRLQDARGWAVITLDLESVARADREAAVRWLGQMRADLMAILNDPQKHELGTVEPFIRVADELDSSVLDLAIRQINLERAQKTWAARWTDAPDELRPLLQRVSSAPGAVGKLASSLLKNYEP
jgi:hypothetical protein